MSLQTPLFNQVQGTILPNGTLSSQFDVQGYSLMGLQSLSNSVNGTLGFMVSTEGDTPNPPGSASTPYRTLYNGAGVPYTITAPSGQFAISSDALTPLKGYQFIRVSSTAQTNGLSLVLTLKAE